MNEWTITAVPTRRPENASTIPGDADSLEEALASALTVAAGEVPAGAERDWEVSCGSRVVRARSDQEAAEIASAEWADEADDKYAVNDPNERYEVRPAHSRGPWTTIYPGLPGAGKADGPQPRRRDEPAWPGEDITSRNRAGVALTGAGVDAPGAAIVLRRAWGHLSATAFLPGTNALARVTYDRDTGQYAVTLPPGTCCSSSGRPAACPVRSGRPKARSLRTVGKATPHPVEYKYEKYS